MIDVLLVQSNPIPFSWIGSPNTNRGADFTYLCSSLRMWTLNVRPVANAGSVSGDRASWGGSQRLNSVSQFWSVFTWNTGRKDLTVQLTRVYSASTQKWPMGEVYSQGQWPTQCVLQCASAGCLWRRWPAGFSPVPCCVPGCSQNHCYFYTAPETPQGYHTKSVFLQPLK